MFKLLMICMSIVSVILIFVATLPLILERVSNFFYHPMR